MSDSLLPGAVRAEVAVEGVRFAVHRGGPAAPTRTPVLLLHGVPQTSAAYRHLFPVLAADRRVIAPDLKGLGESEARGPYDLPTMVAELAALILHEADGPVDVVGHDWGGVLALNLADTRPDLVRRMVVINAPYHKVKLSKAPHIPLFLIPLLPELAFRLSGRRLVEVMLRLAWRAPEPMEPHVRDRYAAAYSDPQRVSAMLGYYRANVWRQLTARKQPSDDHRRPSGLGRLVLWGAADPVMTMPIGESVCHDLGPAAELVALPGIGHFPLEEAAEDSVHAITRFLDAAGPVDIDLTVAAAVSLHDSGLEETDEIDEASPGER